MEDVSAIAEAEQFQSVEDMYPLSPMQKGMLFHTLYSPSSGVYFEQQTTVIRGGLNIPAFEQAWQQALDRHPVLRSVIDWEDLDEPLQVVLRGVQVPLIQYDWRGSSEADQNRRLSEFLNADQERGFDLSQPPLMRLILIRISDDAYYFVWSSHHILLDGWSTALLLQEIFALYDAACQGRQPNLGRSRPFRDYVAWLLQQDLTQAEAFWRETLAGYSSPIPLGPIRPVGGSSQQGFLEVETRLSEKVTEELQAFARQQQVTLNTLVQGAWALLLNRHSGREDVVFGVTVSGRPPDLAGVESIIGLFINTLPLRVRMAPGDSLGPWLKGLQQLQAKMSQFEYSPLVEVHKWSDVPGGLPLFETILVFENYPVDKSMQDSGQGHGLGIRNVKSVEKTNYPLDVTALPGLEFVLRIAWDG
ncbi:MAG: condensation domain-containing protein, partial [Acidobacteriota bacterium]